MWIGFDHAETLLPLIPHGSFVRIRTETLADVTPIHERNLSVVLYLGESEAEFNDPPLVRGRLQNAKIWCDQRGIVPVGVELGEERSWRVQVGSGGDLSQYAAVQGLSAYQRIDLVASRYGAMYGEIHAVFPGVYRLAVEPSWNDNVSVGVGFGGYNPPWPNVDVLGVSHYVGAGLGWGWNQEPTVEARDCWEQDVGARIDAARAYQRPVLVIAQAFSDALWPKVGPAQLYWWYEKALERPQDALMFFCAASFPENDLTGAIDYPDLVAMIGQIVSENT